MPLISQFYGISIIMYYNDHSPPHFHAKYAEFEALINMYTLQMIEGNLPLRALRIVQIWAEQHQNELLENWDLIVHHKQPLTITPLQ